MYVKLLRVYFLKVLLLSFTKVLGQDKLLQTNSLQQSYERKVVSEFAILARYSLKWIIGSVHRVGELAGGGSVDVAVGISDR